MKPPTIPLEKVTALPLQLRTVIPPEYRDENGHMNVRWYMQIFDEAGYPMAASYGVTLDYHAQHNTGGFDLEHHVHYLREVLIGDTVAIHSRILGRSQKRIHYLMFMVNETRGTLAAIFECVNAFADMTVRRTAPYPPEIAARIDAHIQRDTALDWATPVCGVMGP
ncbi:MAG: thioesterase family protein [Anaerolineae bacterium]|nr:thioesterase family protein [Anaerolineae bacterium]